MSAGQTYPSPNAAQMGHGANPFYGHQLPRAEDIELAAQLNRETVPDITRAMGEGQNMQPIHSDVQDSRQLNIDSPQQNFMQQAAKSGQALNQDSSIDDAVARRKSKVSRACDECRRKKIKCDADAESPNADKCSNCKRTTATCQFSRVPMKRGPSKGYIKELADRLQRVEQSVRVPDLQNSILNQSDTSPQSHAYPLPSDAMETASRKRTHSMSEMLPQQAYMQAQLQNMNQGFHSAAGWSSNDAAVQLTQQNHGYQNKSIPQVAYTDTNYMVSNHKPQLSPNGVVPVSWRRESNGIVSGLNEARVSEVDGQGEVSFQWDEQLIDEYYRIIHPVLPILTHSKLRLRSYLGKVSMTIRDALLEALYAATRLSPGASVSRPANTVANKTVHDLFNAYQSENVSSHDYLSNLVFVQASILMVVSLDMSGPPKLQALPGPSKDVWFGMAVGMAKSLKLHGTRTLENNATEDVDSPELIGRRTWWSLIIVDRWHACGASAPLSFPDSSAQLQPGDSQLLGDSVYHLARLSLVLGHISEIFVCSTFLPSITSPHGLIISRLLSGEISRFREALNNEPNIVSMPLVHLAYWHVRLLQKRHTPSSSSEIGDIVGSAKIVASMLLSNDHPISPLTHHFAVLSTMTLVELMDVKGAKEEALEGLFELRQAIEKGRVSSPAALPEGTVGWDTVLLDCINRKLHHGQLQQVGNDPTIDRGGLQHLADLAVGESEGTSGEKAKEDAVAEANAGEMDWTVLTKAGYLTVFE